MAAKKILLVEDDNNLREIYGARLQAEGYDIVSAPDGENALAIAVKEKPDLIISDVMMPKVSGFDMLDILRNAPETKDTKVIMMTALSQAEDKARADKLGADMYLVKSQVTLEDVTKAVHSILDEPSEATQEADSAAAQAMVSGASKADQKPKIQQPAEEKSEEKKAEEQNVTPAAEPVKPAPAPQEPVEDKKPETPTVQQQPVEQPVEPPRPEPVASPQPAAPTPAEEPKSSATEQAVQPQQPTQPAEPQSTNNITAIPVSVAGESSEKTSQDSSGEVTPNLAQALADEEKSVQEKIESFEKSEPQPPAPADPATQTIQEQATTNNSVNTPETSDSKEEKPGPSLLDEKPSKKVIKPINDPTKGPNLDELIAKEEAKEAAGNNSSDQSSQVIKPSSSDSASQSAQTNQNTPDSEHHDEFGKISL